MNIIVPNITRKEQKPIEEEKNLELSPTRLDLIKTAINPSNTKKIENSKTGREINELCKKYRFTKFSNWEYEDQVKFRTLEKKLATIYQNKIVRHDTRDYMGENIGKGGLKFTGQEFLSFVAKNAGKWERSGGLSLNKEHAQHEKVEKRSVNQVHDPFPNGFGV